MTDLTDTAYTITAAVIRAVAGTQRAAVEALGLHRARRVDMLEVLRRSVEYLPEPLD